MAEHEATANEMSGHEMTANELTANELTQIREAYTGKINAAIGAGDDNLAIELSTQFRDEAFEALADVNARRVA
jgi:hypothetical protein